MASFNSWNGVPMHAQKYLLTDVLKKELGFNGFVVSDWQGVDRVVVGNYRASLKASINAGVDMVMEPKKWKQTVALLVDLMNKGEITMERADDAVRRILRVKYAINLFDNPYSDWTHFDTIGCTTHRAVAREAVNQSYCLKTRITPCRSTKRERPTSLPEAMPTTRAFSAAAGLSDGKA
jgi:beta-glucosidase